MDKIVKNHLNAKSDLLLSLSKHPTSMASIRQTKWGKWAKKYPDKEWLKFLKGNFPRHSMIIPSCNVKDLQGTSQENYISQGLCQELICLRHGPHYMKHHQAILRHHVLSPGHLKWYPAFLLLCTHKLPYSPKYSPYDIQSSLSKLHFNYITLVFNTFNKFLQTLE